VAASADGGRAEICEWNTHMRFDREGDTERDRERDYVCVCVCVCSASVYLRYNCTKWVMSGCQRRWRYKADAVKTEYKHPEASWFIQQVHNVVSDTQYLAGCDSKNGRKRGGGFIDNSSQELEALQSCGEPGGSP